LNNESKESKITDLRPVELIKRGFGKTPAIDRKRFTKEQKCFMIKLFEEGEKTKKKYSA